MKPKKKKKGTISPQKGAGAPRSYVAPPSTSKAYQTDRGPKARGANLARGRWGIMEADHSSKL
jgi:hypothetical protein